MSPSVSFTDKIPSSALIKAASKVPPPKSKTNQKPSLIFEPRPKAVAAATGSCNSSICLKPNSLAASLVASFCGFKNFAGTVITIELIFSSFTTDLSVFRISADNSSEVNELNIFELS